MGTKTIKLVLRNQVSLHFKNLKKMQEPKKSSKANPIFYKREFGSYELEKDYKDFDFIAWPFVILSGLFSKHEVTGLWVSRSLEKDIAAMFGVAPNKKNIVSISNFLEREYKRFKKNPEIRRGHHSLSLEVFKDKIRQGIEFCFLNGVSPENLRKSLRTKIPRSGVPLQFSTIGRLIWNGHTDSDWYDETRETFVKSFPNHNIQLICDLFAATSIRASLESNVTKFFKAFHQLHENKTQTSYIGERGNKKPFESVFHGFLDSTLINLQKIADGKRPGNPEKSGRKIYNFSEALNGNTRAIVADIWVIRAFDVDLLYSWNTKGNVSRSPDTNTYNAIEYYLQTLGDFLGREPRGVCASIWCAIRWEEGHTSNTTRYDHFVKYRLDHGLFEDQYGLISSDGLRFLEKSS